MDHFREAAASTAKIGSAWAGVWFGYAIEHVTWTVVASFAATVYSVVQTYISIMRYRRER